MRSALPAAGLAGGTLLLATLLALTPAVQRWNGDIRLFEHYAGLTFAGYLGKTAFLSWYPPYSLVPLGLPLLFGTGPTYVLALAAEMSLVAGAGIALVRRFGERLDAAPWAVMVYAALALAMTVIVAWRYDIVPAITTLGAFAAVVSGWWLVAGVALGAAAGLKIYAALLVPVFILWAWRRGGVGAGGLVAVGAALTGIVAVGAYLLFPGASPFELLAFSAARPLHVESVPGSVLALLASLGAGSMSLIYDSGSFNVVTPAAGPAIDGLRVLQPILLLISLGLAAFAIVGRVQPSPRLLVSASAVVLIALLVSNRVLSPQYLIWLLPIAALAGGWLRWLLVGAIGITAIVFPWLYSGLIDGQPLPLLLIVIRNVLFAGAWVAAAASLTQISVRRGRLGERFVTGGAA